MSRYVVPDVILTMEGSEWPPARDRLPAGSSFVGTWQVDRELVASSIPGQILVRTGLSVGTASATIRQEVKGKKLAPWAVTPARKVTVGAPAKLRVDLPRGGVNLGDWQVAPVRGGLVDASVSVDLVESSYGMRTRPNSQRALYRAEEFPTPYWVLQGLASAAGYPASPPLPGPDAPGSMIEVPFQGHVEPSVGFPLNAVGVGEFTKVEGRGYARTFTGPGGRSPLTLIASSYEEPFPPGAYHVLPRRGSTFISFDVLMPTGNGSVILGVTFTRQTAGAAAPYIDVELSNLGVSLYLSGNGSPSPSGPVTVPLNPIPVGGRNLARVVIEYDTTAEVTVLDGQTLITTWRARVRTEGSGGWSAWVTDTPPVGNTVTGSMTSVRLAVAPVGPNPGAIANFQVTSQDPTPRVYAPFTPRAVIDWQDGQALGWFPGEMDTWTALQQYAEAWLMAAWIDLDGVLQIRDRYYLAGAGRVPEVIDVDRLVEDVQWVSDPADSTDRLEVTYRPLTPVSRDEDGSLPVLWESTIPYEVGAGQTITITANLTSPGLPVGGFWDQVSSATVAPYNRNLYGAAYTVDGGGDAGMASGVLVSHTVKAAGRLEITVTNHGSRPAWMVDGNGKPCIIVRASRMWSQDTEAVTSRGRSAEEAEKVSTVDLGTYVTSERDANQIATFLWGRAARKAWRAESVRMPVAWRRDLSDLLQLSYPEQDLNPKALVTKVSLSGGPGEATQRVDLTILPETWEDWDGIMAPQTPNPWTWRTWDLMWSQGQNLMPTPYGYRALTGSTTYIPVPTRYEVDQGDVMQVSALITNTYQGSDWGPVTPTFSLEWWAAGNVSSTPSGVVSVTVDPVPLNGRPTLREGTIALTQALTPSVVQVRLRLGFSHTAPVGVSDVKLIRNPNTTKPGGVWEDFDANPMRRE